MSFIYSGYFKGKPSTKEIPEQNERDPIKGLRPNF